ncbi:VOC family protein [Flavobacterium zepuense]|uniref:VOC family protein n=1 Tax=Flavobacterium zepuense TaxID=2593302 RepID=A0A552V306_9FLAO|nr:VOC family protein [Flavobacterium zepuense]TRW24870.1 VOC family protein [Flavobacterium zepuense]
MNIPATYLPVMPYLILDNAPDFLEYAKKVFGAIEQYLAPGEDGRSIMHGEIKINDAIIMFASSNSNWQQKTSGMFIYVESVDRVYNAGIEQGGTSLQSPAKQEYGYAAGFEDPFGNHWWINQPL